jgi:hypothetical protein
MVKVSGFENSELRLRRREHTSVSNIVRPDRSPGLFGEGGKKQVLLNLDRTLLRLNITS